MSVPTRTEPRPPGGGQPGAEEHDALPRGGGHVGLPPPVPAPRPPFPGASALGSPIGSGFLVVSGAVRAAARERGGPAAFEIEYDEDDEQGDEVLTAPWRRATHALLHAAMALGAPHLTAEPDRAILTGPWRAIGNADVGPGRGPAR